MFQLEIFRETLDEQVQRRELSPRTRDDYMANLRRLEEICGEGEQEDSFAEILEKSILDICKDSKQIPKYIAAVKKYERDVLGSSNLLLYGQSLANLRTAKPTVKMGKPLSHSESTYAHKINGLKNEKLKLAFRLQKQSGLRVAEIAKLHKHDLIFSEANKMEIIVREGKGGKRRIVHLVDAYLFENLQKFIEQKSEEEKLFYSASYLKKKAWEYGMQTHDLRRINSRQRFREKREGGASRRQARRIVAQELGHDDVAVTNLYLGEEWEE